MFDKDSMTPDEKAEYALGETLYKELTANGKRYISTREIAELQDNETNAITAYLFWSNIDFTQDLIATQTLENILGNAVVRTPSDVSVEEKFKGFFEQIVT